MGIQTAMDAVYAAPGIVDAIRLADDVAFEAGRDPGVRTLRLLAKALASEDDVAAITAVHALAEMYDEQAARALSGLLSDERGFIREHAAWALGAGLPRFDAIGRLLGIVAAGGFSGMLAQRTLENWSITIGESLAVAIESALLGIQDAPSRTRLVETLGLVRAPIAARTLLICASDPHEPRTVRIAAVAALGQRAHSAEAASLLGDLAGRCRARSPRVRRRRSGTQGRALRRSHWPHPQHSSMRPPRSSRLALSTAKRVSSRAKR